MQTPIEQLIERLEAMRDKILQEIEKLPPVCIGKIELCAKRDTLNFAITQAKELLEVEEEMIKEVYNDGKCNGMDISHPLSIVKEIKASDYLKDAFKNKDKL
tara:strand:+ start:4069 stop:4374 length:306 start_codon:yes stop_codon:yes gene_type:complete